MTPEILEQVTEYLEMIDLVGFGTVTIRIDNHKILAVVPAFSVPPRQSGQPPGDIIKFSV